MAIYKINVDFSSKNGWFVARLGDNAIWVLPQDAHDKFTINLGSSEGVTSKFQFNISERSKCIDGTIEAFEKFGAASATMDICVETNEDKIELSLGDIEGTLHFKSDVDHLEFDTGGERSITLRLK
jgi:hypothetical protein